MGFSGVGGIVVLCFVPNSSPVGKVLDSTSDRSFCALDSKLWFKVGLPSSNAFGTIVLGRGSRLDETDGVASDKRWPFVKEGDLAILMTRLSSISGVEAIWNRRSFEEGDALVGVPPSTLVAVRERLSLVVHDLERSSLLGDVSTISSSLATAIDDTIDSSPKELASVASGGSGYIFFVVFCSSSTSVLVDIFSASKEFAMESVATPAL